MTFIESMHNKPNIISSPTSQLTENTASGQNGPSVRARAQASWSVTATVIALCPSVAEPAKDLTPRSLTATWRSPAPVRNHVIRYSTSEELCKQFTLVFGGCVVTYLPIPVRFASPAHGLPLCQ